jgi:hypothetical protein
VHTLIKERHTLTSLNVSRRTKSIEELNAKYRMASLVIETFGIEIKPIGFWSRVPFLKCSLWLENYSKKNYA